MILMIDNYDSFTYNIVQYLGELGATIEVHRNDEITLDQIDQLNPEKIVISPGPCTPNEAGISMDVIREFGQSIPTLGICLGHQSIGQVYGGEVVRAREVMHGKLSYVHHNGRGVFQNLPDQIEVTRYHSLVVSKSSVPDCLEITAWTEMDDGTFDEVMAFRHREFDVEGVQFHPESIKTQAGHELLSNFLRRNVNGN
ncbi:MAG: aminodeoxychorismate/anthranilate synthase component II [Pseudomonadota bacterium]|uniref:Glutamine amidotransferase domain-containing protein n=1 Tax=marine metagenome TaxID=408172 RepID=A0A382LRS5_9ZZZZ|nr:aminodeoxychorismate/anthranilate synthase component II [Pseudomonadota bacterium]MEE3182714.1 aminodeoxychorismate/anthranilate synthase component II [Pseudomonadota bacterium]